MKTGTHSPKQGDKESVYESLRAEIISGRTAPGDPISERDLADHFGLSRTPIREVLHRLSMNGLIEIYPNRGAFVRRLDPRLISDIFEAREAIEPMACGLAAIRHPEPELGTVIRRLEQLVITDEPATMEAAVATGSDLHDAIFDWAGNALLTDFYRRLKDQASLIRLLTRRSQEIEEASRIAHLLICMAIQSRDRPAAERAMRSHLTRTRQMLLAQL